MRGARDGRPAHAAATVVAHAAVADGSHADGLHAAAADAAPPALLAARELMREAALLRAALETSP